MSLKNAALRLYPSLPVNTRAALRTTVLPTGGGPDRNSPVLIPKGAAVAYSVYTMHRRPDLYGMDAELYRPERWDEDMPLNHNETNAKWGYLPFNGGPRICLGSERPLLPVKLGSLLDTNLCFLLQWILRLQKPPTQLCGLFRDSRRSSYLMVRL